MANTFKFGNGNWAVKDGYALAYNDENNNFKPLPFEFTRASSATRVNKQGLIETVGSGKPRIDFTDNTSGHLLLEPSRTNLVTYSEDFSNVYWTKNGSSVTSGFISPDGTDNAFKLTKTSSGNSIVRLVSGLTNVNYTFSIYIKKVNGSENVSIILPNGGNTQVTISNEWERYDVTSLPSGGTGAFVGVILSTIGDEVLIYGAQLEQGSYATSYIPTEGSSVTRVREICEQDSLSNLIGQTEGVIYYDYTATFEAPSTSFDFFPISVYDGTNSNYFFLNNYNQALTIGYRVSGTTIISNNSFTFNSGDRIKVAFAYKQNDFAAYINGTQILTLSSGSVAALNEVTLGNYYNNQANLQDDVKVNELRFYDTRLTNTELQNLTS